MPNEKLGAENRRASIRPHPLVEKLASDPASPPHRLVRLIGYPGPSPIDGMTRLWLNLDFTECVDVPDGEVVHCDEGIENGPSTLFVIRGTKLEHTVISSTAVQADFLSGEITARNLAGALAFEQGPLAPMPVWGPRNQVLFPSAYYLCYQVYVTFRNDCFRVFDTLHIRCGDPVIKYSEIPILCGEVPGIPDLPPGTRLVVEIARDVVRETIREAGLNPQPLPPRGPLTRPG